MTINLNESSAFKVFQSVLLIIIIGLLVWSRPWSDSTSTQTRKTTVKGQATIEASPDEYQFSPYFQQKGTDKDAMKKILTSQANDAVDAIKELGVSEDDIKLDVSSYDNWYWKSGEEGVLSANLTIKVSDKELAQKIQDYLLNTEAEGQLTPYATFSEEKKKELDAQVLDQAIDDAKEKAEQQAKKLGVTVGKVLEVAQDQDSVFPIAYDTMSVLESAPDSSRNSLPVLSGQNEYTQSVTVTYELK